MALWSSAIQVMGTFGSMTGCEKCGSKYLQHNHTPYDNVSPSHQGEGYVCHAKEATNMEGKKKSQQSSEGQARDIMKGTLGKLIQILREEAGFAKERERRIQALLTELEATEEARIRKERRVAKRAGH